MMTGELMEVTGNELKLVSLDGHRMSIRKVALKEQYSDIKVIVPGKTLGEIEKIVWRMISFKVNWESVMNLSRSMWGI